MTDDRPTDRTTDRFLVWLDKHDRGSRVTVARISERCASQLGMIETDGAAVGTTEGS
jgi:hypothetical protein